MAEESFQENLFDTEYLKAEINNDQISTLFWINVMLSLSIALITAALAPAIAWFYGEQRLLEQIQGGG